MKRRLVILIFLILGILGRGLASLSSFLITSDIPVSYSTSEALVVHILFFISTIFFLLSSILYQSNKARILTGVLFALMFTYSIIIFISWIGADYYNASFAQLKITSLLNSGLIMVFNFFLVIKSQIYFRNN